MEVAESLPYNTDVTMPEVQNPTFTEFNVRQDKGKPCFIRLHDSVVKSLERLLASGGGQPGILIGSIEAGANVTIAVEDFEPAPKVDERIRSWTPRAGSRRQVVGCYWSHSRPEFSLDQTDRALFQRFFPKEGRLLLQVKPSKTDVAPAMCFLGENGTSAKGSGAAPQKNGYEPRACNDGAAGQSDCQAACSLSARNGNSGDAIRARTPAADSDSGYDGRAASATHGAGSPSRTRAAHHAAA